MAKRYYYVLLSNGTPVYEGCNLGLVKSWLRRKNLKVFRLESYTTNGNNAQVFYVH